MSIFFCVETCGFYLPGMQPVGLTCVEISGEAHEELRAKNATGKIIAVGADGLPVAIEPPPPNEEQVAAGERAWRDVQLSQAAVLRDRHRDQVEIGAETALSSEQFTELLVYMQALRDWPQSLEFPNSEDRPHAPAWIAEPSE